MSARRLQPREEHDRIVIEVFLDALDEAIPGDAVNELYAQAASPAETDRDFVECWTQRWNINAPCVIRKALENIQGARRHGPNWPLEFGRGLSDVERNDQRFGSIYPDEWREKLRGLDIGGPVEGSYELASLSADPGRESLKDFLARAADHWNARARMARSEFGFVPMALKPELARHASWLVQKHLLGKSYEEIGLSQSGGTRIATADAVRKAVVRMAKTLDLARISQPGRQPERPDK